ncbi:tRNA pseudouridine synthase [Thalictrum thalictroides]|uniref:tRNA pseudouridine synthase n=1 Tax=Thalictrum thalictroides TaxID=46969 RepID=A0A7J6WT38_THATH|nr:tRNA pseudouridine synthase [Thalictrum thalictroides]
MDCKWARLIVRFRVLDQNSKPVAKPKHHLFISLLLRTMDSTCSPSSPNQEPEPVSKKLKMSTTTTSDDDDETTTTNTTTDPFSNDRKPRYKRRKIAIFLAYCGVGYQGMQKNPGAKTIEGELEEALYLAGGVPEHDRGKPKRFDWARSARTDKGVSAVGQVVSGRFYIDPPGFIDRLNSILPNQIRIFGFKRTTSSFNAKKFCDRRRYVYLIPVFALDTNSHRDRESVLASLGSENELVKCLDCSERGRKVAGAMGRHNNSEPKVDDNETKIEFESGVCLSNNGSVTMEENLDNGIRVEIESGVSFNNKGIVATVQEENLSNQIQVELESGVFSNNNAIVAMEVKEGKVGLVPVECSNNEDVIGRSENGSGFCYGEKEKKRFNRILNSYVGTHNFHNFTTRIKAEDPSAIRYIISFTANNVVTVNGIDFVKCEVVGQSFMLHQIRKLIGLAVAIMRNCAPESLVEYALQKEVNINVPTAPEVGLFLDECFFTSYNQKWKDTHEEILMEAYAEQAEDFKMKQVYSHIASMEQKEGSVAIWLHSLNYRNYPDLCYAGDTKPGDNQEKVMAEENSSTV